MTDIAALSDVELRQALQSHGFNVGPIVPSSRGVYEKKLAKLNSTNESDALNSSQVLELNGSQVAPPSLVSRISPAPITRASPAPITKASPAPVLVTRTSPEPAAEEESKEDDGSDIEDYEGEESMRYLTEEEMAAERDALNHNRKKSNRSGNLLILTVTFAAIGVFAYFLLENAEMFLAINSAAPSNDDNI